MSRAGTAWAVLLGICLLGVGGTIAHVGVWLGVSGRFGAALMAATALCAALAWWQPARTLLVPLVCASFVGRAVTAWFIGIPGYDTRTRVVSGFVWWGAWLVSVAALALLAHDRRTDHAL